MKIVYSKKIVRALSFGFADGITLWPFILIGQDQNNSRIFRVLVNHEMIHARQQAELAVVFFYIFYGISFLYHLAKSRKFQDAYQNNIFEVEAYKNQDDLFYLKSRKFLGFLRK